MAKGKESRNCSRGPLHLDEINMFMVVYMIMLRLCNNRMMLRFCNSLIMLKFYNCLCGGCHIPCLRNLNFKICVFCIFGSNNILLSNLLGHSIW